jgi:hypothetical protein
LDFATIISLHRKEVKILLLVSGLSMLYHNFYCIFFSLSPFDIPWSQGTLLNLTWVVQCLKLALSKGPNRVGVPPSSEDENRPSFRKVTFSSFQNTGRWIQLKKTE